MPVPGTHTEPPSHRLVTGRVIANVAALTDPLYVYIESFGRQRSLVKGWTPTTPLPKAGDECLVAYDLNGNPWVIAWASPA